ncbi:radical SAM domain-containing protein [Oscillochloris trichoides DG-6]|uniref:Radical SAM domain-containing protein n=1 Tax=Oscillochloris trichoides DG-6 TaxID=765420 RepID=E1IGP2_9CHLR|nr:B12-binding domain-containing radical SAM protein [Oscillochloris trichoides]EFO79629.1 radical SAM domain-containing protein [Oscillochloris trichoides DG-6]
MDSLPSVLLAQLPVPSSPLLNTPLASGYLVAYAQAQGWAERVRFAILPRSLADHAGDADVVAAIVAHAPDLLAFSLYTWNSERSLAIAERVKEHLPHVLVLVGGPEVQRDNPWILHHPAVDLAVVGAGEATFVEILEWWQGPRDPAALLRIPGVVRCCPGGAPRFAPPRSPLPDLMQIPSPYLSGWLDLPLGSLQPIEISRFCPYTCSYCLYGRHSEQTSFSLERVLAEIAWGRERGIERVHLVEANLNLQPIFWPLMHALAELNADRQQTFYAELRAEYVDAASVAALVAANVTVVEVGLQSANPAALRAIRRHTDLERWAAGVERLMAAGIEVLLDVILGLPGDDAAGVALTRAFLHAHGLAHYDTFMLQVLPGTRLRREAAQHGIIFQARPPYAILATPSLSYVELRHLRRELKAEAGYNPDGREGLPPVRATQPAGTFQIVQHHSIEDLDSYTPKLHSLMQANPSSVVDLFLEVRDTLPNVEALHAWRETLPYQPSYLDYVNVYLNNSQVRLRLWLVVPWVVQVEPQHYAGVAEVLWRYVAVAGEVLPLGAWRVAGGAGIALEGADAEQHREALAWAKEYGRVVVKANPPLPQAGEGGRGVRAG